MSVSLRLARRGSRHRPYYHIVAASKRSPRDGRFLEKLGTYDPARGSTLQLDVAAADAWLAKGAHPSPTVDKLIRRARSGAQPV